jgi:hypothetical protein
MARIISTLGRDAIFRRCQAIALNGLVGLCLLMGGSDIASNITICKA